MKGPGYAEGRLDDAELKERLDRAMGAKTRADLAGLMDDLPPLSGPGSEPGPPPRRHRLAGAAVVAMVALLAVGAVTAPAHVAWLPAVLVVLVLASRRHGCGHRSRRLLR